MEGASMEGSAPSRRPRSCTGGRHLPPQYETSRVTKQPPRGLYHRLHDRELDQKLRQSFPRRCTRERFSHLKLRLSLDVFATCRVPEGVAPMMERRCRVEEICSAGDLLFGLTENGVCCAFERLSGRRTCILNKDSSEVVRSLFHNKSNATLITVSVYSADSYSSLRCRATPLSCLLAGITSTGPRRPSRCRRCTLRRAPAPHGPPTIPAGVPLFEGESLRWPGFVEFDDVNGKVLTYSATDQMYKIWSMADPTSVLYSLPDAKIEEIKVSPGIMLLMGHRNKGRLPLQVRCIESGTVLNDICQIIDKGAQPSPRPRVRCRDAPRSPCTPRSPRATARQPRCRGARRSAAVAVRAPFVIPSAIRHRSSHA